MRRFLLAITVAAVGLLAVVPGAFAADGLGLVGVTNDKMITFFCFGVMIFFTALVIVMSWIQHRRDTRKEQHKVDAAKVNGDS